MNNEIIKPREYKTGDRIVIIGVDNKDKVKHLTNNIGESGEVISYQHLTKQDKANGIQKLKIRLDKNGETYYYKNTEVKPFIEESEV